MKRNFSAAITDFNGNPVTSGASVEAFAKALVRIMANMSDEQRAAAEKILAEETGTPLTLGTVATNALTASFEDERGIGGDEKAKRFKLALRVHAADEVEVSAEDVTLIKSLLGKAYAPLVVGRAYELLEQE